MKGRILLMTMLLTVATISMGQTNYEKYIDAANQGDAEAQYQIGLCFSKGDGVKLDLKKAKSWFEKSAKQEHGKAQFEYAKLLNNKNSVIWYEKAAEHGVDQAFFNLGMYYSTKVGGVMRDINKAIFWFKKAAEKNVEHSCWHLGYLYNNEIIDKEQALYWHKKSAEQENDMSSQYFLGELYQEKEDYQQAIKWYQLALKNYEKNGFDTTYIKNGLLSAANKLRQQNVLAGLTSSDQSQQPSSQPVQQFASTPVAAPVAAPKPSSPVDKDIPVIDQVDRNTFAIVIGNEKYKNVAEVPFAGNDAKIFGEYVQKTLGVPEDQIKLLENATYNDIRMALNWVEKAMTLCSGKGKIIVFYAGHGIPNESDNSAYLLPVDGIGNDPTSAYSLKDFYQKLGSMQAQSITVFLDACFSGSKRDNGMLVAARGVAIKAKASAPKGNMVVFSAAQGDETAYPYQDMLHGMFTYFLLKKLQETKGSVTLGELGDYLKDEVKRQSFLKNNKMQTPMVSVATSLQNSWKQIKLR